MMHVADDGRWTMDDGRWTMDDGRWTMDDSERGLSDQSNGRNGALSSSIVHRPSSIVLPHCGIDLVDIDRITEMVLRFGERFLTRVWTEEELVICRGRYPELAARFAGKEAAMKALGTGVKGVGWREIEILRDELGKPVLTLHGGAATRASHLGLTSWSISLTHSKLMACAVVVAV